MLGPEITRFLIKFVDVLRNIIVFAIIARILVSWLRVGGRRMTGNGQRAVEILHDITDPFIKLARKIPHKAGMFDFAPLIALIGVDLLAQLVIVLIANLV